MFYTKFSIHITIGIFLKFFVSSYLFKMQIFHFVVFDVIWRCFLTIKLLCTLHADFGVAKYMKQAMRLVYGRDGRVVDYQIRSIYRDYKLKTLKVCG